jgi:hypothetical protein
VVDLDDEFVGRIDEGGRLTDGGGGNQPVFADGDGLDDGHVGVDQPAVLHFVAQRGDVTVAEGDFVAVDLLASLRRRLIRVPPGDGIGLDEGGVDFLADAAAADDCEFEVTS